jgi:hypothetical protein
LFFPAGTLAVYRRGVNEMPAQGERRLTSGAQNRFSVTPVFSLPRDMILSGRL